MKQQVRHISAVLKLPRRASSIGAFAQAIIAAMTGNSNFPTPTPALATLEADLSAFNAAEGAVLARTKGAAEERNAKLAILRADLLHLMDYIQGRADADPSNADSIIHSAGMNVRNVTLHAKTELSATHGSVTGSAKLVAKAVARRASYEWQYSIDQKTWSEAPSTLQAKTVIDGLNAGTAYFFRFRSVTKVGEGGWSQIVSLLVT